MNRSVVKAMRIAFEALPQAAFARLYRNVIVRKAGIFCGTQAAMFSAPGFG